MQSKLQCMRVEQGDSSGDDCDCPACTMRRTLARAQERARTAPSPVIRAESQTPSTAVNPANKKPSTEESRRKALIKAEEQAREAVEQYLISDLKTTDWDEIVGNEEPLKLLRRVIEAPVLHAELYEFYGVKTPRGVLLEGPAGCGKTMMARAAASACARVHGADRPALLRINGPEIQTPLVGMTEKIVRDIFAYARAFHARYNYPLTIFIDEADAILPPRDGLGGRPAQSWESSQVAAFLTEMDGITEGGAMVLLATNRAHAIDAAVLRPGRIDIKIRVGRPEPAACVRMLVNALAGAPMHLPFPTLKGFGVGCASREGKASIAARATLAQRAIDFLLSPAHVISTLQSDVGPLHLTMKHIVSGALIAELGNRTKALAFERDLSAGTRTGIMDEDATSAAHALIEESSRGSFPDAIRDLCVAAGARIAATVPIGASISSEESEEINLSAVPRPRKTDKLN